MIAFDEVTRRLPNEEAIESLFHRYVAEIILKQTIADFVSLRSRLCEHTTIDFRAKDPKIREKLVHLMLILEG